MKQNLKIHFHNVNGSFILFELRKKEYRSKFFDKNQIYSSIRSDKHPADHLSTKRIEKRH
jgi:hypothetical protein